MNLARIFNISENIENFLTDTDVLSEYETLLLRHGISILLQDGSEMISALILGSLMHRTAETLIFLICFCTLRVHAGGFHARTPAGCYCGFMALFLAVLGFCSIRIPFCISGILSILSALYIVFRAPAEHPLNPLTPDQKASAGRSAFYLTSFSLICEAVLICLHSAYVNPITAALLLNCILMILLQYPALLKGRKDAGQ